VNVPTPTPDDLLFLLVGLSVPFDFAMRRLRGFGKWGLSKLPQYDPETEDGS